MNDPITYIDDRAVSAAPDEDAWAASGTRTDVCEGCGEERHVNADHFCRECVDRVRRVEEVAASMADLVGYVPLTDGECSSEWPEAPDFEPLTVPQFEALVRRLMLLRAERDAIAANSEAMCADLDRQIARILEVDDAQLRHYVDGGYGRKSVRCPWGLLGVRKGGGRVHIVDLPRALESVRELAPSALRETVDLAKLPPRFTAPGFDVTPETSSLYVQGLPRNRKSKTESEDDSE